MSKEFASFDKNGHCELPWDETLMGRLQITVLHASAADACATMVVSGNQQPAGLLHGGASAALAETIASIAAQQHCGPDRVSVGTELNISHLRPVRFGQVTAQAKAIYLGKNSAIYNVSITDDSEHLVAQARMRCQLLPAVHSC